MDREHDEPSEDIQPAPKRPFWVGMTAPELLQIMNAEFEKRGFFGRIKLAPEPPPEEKGKYRVYFLPASRYKPKPSGSGGEGSK